MRGIVEFRRGVIHLLNVTEGCDRGACVNVRDAILRSGVRLLTIGLGVILIEDQIGDQHFASIVRVWSTVRAQLPTR